MSASGIPIWLPALTNDSGAPVSGAKIYGFVPDSNGAPTASPVTLYTDAGLTTPAAIPHVANAGGRAVLYRSPAISVVIVVKSSDTATTYSTVYFAEGINGGDLGDGWPDAIGDDADNAFNWLPIRERLTANRTYFIDHVDGDNDNDGLTADTAFATINYAWNWLISRIDLARFNVILQVADNEFDEAILLLGIPIGYYSLGSIILRGNVTTPASCYNNHQGVFAALTVAENCFVRVEGFKLATPNSPNHCVKVYHGGYLETSKIAFGTCQAACLQGADGMIIVTGRGSVTGTISFAGITATQACIAEVGGGGVDLTSASSVDVTGATFTAHPGAAFVAFGEGSYFAAPAANVWVGSFTGRKFFGSDFGVGSTQDELDAIPGSIEGVWKNPILTEPQCRLTLTDNTPVTTGDVTAATTLFLEPYVGDYSIFPVLGAASYEMVATGTAGLSMALDSNNAHSGFHASGKNFDVFTFVKADGTFSIGTGPAWTNDTTRSADISRANGVYSNTLTMTIRWGTGSGDTFSAAAGAAVYLGTIRTTGDGQTEDSAAKRFVFNASRRRPRSIRIAVGTDTWTGSGAASWRYFNNDAANRAEFVVGLFEDAFEAVATLEAISDQATVRPVRVGVGVNANTAIATGCLPAMIGADNTTYKAATSSFRGYGQLGFNYAAPLEFDNASDTRTYRGDAGSATNCQTGLVGMVMA